jgi:uncharacterized membrane protein YphA (DoxX/SURF4 family)
MIEWGRFQWMRGTLHPKGILPLRQAQGCNQVKALIVRIILAGLFIYAGMIKLMQPDTFLADIESYRMMPYSLAWMVAFYLPPLEILCGLGLLVPKFRKPSAVILLLLMIVFIIAISVAWTRGLNIACGCFGTSTEEATNYPWLIVRDLLRAGGLAFVLWWKRLKLDGVICPETTAGVINEAPTNTPEN